MKKFGIFFLCAQMALFAASANVANFDIAGVKLGMSEAEAKAAIIKTLNIKESDINQGMGDGMDNPINGKKYKSYAIIKHGVGEFWISFEPNAIMPQKSPTVVSAVSYKMEWTTENVANMKKAAYEKYGKPSIDGQGTADYWCEKAEQFGCDDRMAKLQFSNAELRLSDQRYRDALNAWRDKQKSGKPTF